MSREEEIGNRKLRITFCPEPKEKIDFEIKYKHIPKLFEVLFDGYTDRYKSYDLEKDKDE